MRKIALLVVTTAFATPSFAGDLPQLSLPPAPAILVESPSAYDWNGLYAGLQIGGVFGTSNFFPSDLGAHTFVTNGVFGGGVVGYNRQIGSLVLGAEGEFNGSAANGSLHNSLILDGYKTSEVWTGALNGRFGYAFDETLFYVVGGAAFVGLEHDSVNSNSFDTRFHSNDIGFDIGAGIEYAFMTHWSARLEYRYVDYGRVNAGYVATAHQSFSQVDNTVRVGITYHFGGQDGHDAYY